MHTHKLDFLNSIKVSNSTICAWKAYICYDYVNWRVTNQIGLLLVAPLVQSMTIVYDKNQPLILTYVVKFQSAKNVMFKCMPLGSKIYNQHRFEIHTLS